MPQRPHNHLAIDLGASNGRIVRGRFDVGPPVLEVIHRFEHLPVQRDGTSRWDWDEILQQVHIGLARAAQACADEEIASVSCSSWAQDFGLIDADGQLFYPPVSYRDRRTAGMPASFADLIAPGDLIRRVGCGLSPVTALCQLRAMAVHERAALERARTLLFVADLVHWHLCGSQTTDWTMATASQLRHLQTGRWDRELLDRLDIPHHFLPDVLQHPHVVGRIPADNRIHPRLAGVPVLSTAGHDTAVATACLHPLDRGTFFLILGTWAMLGVCTGQPTLPPDIAQAGWYVLGLVGGKWGLFRAGTGLWLLQECRRQWESQGLHIGHEQLAADAQNAAITATIDPSDPRFDSPADMPAAIAQACTQAGRQVPHTPGEFARVIFDSLAAHYAEALAQLQQAAGLQADRLHVLGGGSRNPYLCRRIADSTGLPVLIGPPEATALGSILLRASVAQTA